MGIVLQIQAHIFRLPCIPVLMLCLKSSHYGEPKKCHCAKIVNLLTAKHTTRHTCYIFMVFFLRTCIFLRDMQTLRQVLCYYFSAFLFGFFDIHQNTGTEYRSRFFHPANEL